MDELTKNIAVSVLRDEEGSVRIVELYERLGGSPALPYSVTVRYSRRSPTAWRGLSRAQEYYDTEVKCYQAIGFEVEYAS